MIRCLIVEDEESGQMLLQRKLKKYFPECSIEAIIDNREDTISFLKNNPVDLVFMDIHILGGNGLYLLDEINSSEFKTIFITGYSEYAIDALNKNAAYYILKPIHDSEFVSGVGKIIGEIKALESPHIIVPHRGLQQLIALDSIIYLQSEGAYTRMICEQQTLVVSKNLGQLEEKLYKPQFIRPHRSFIINVNRIEQIKSGKTAQIVLEGGIVIPISQRRSSMLLKHVRR